MPDVLTAQFTESEWGLISEELGKRGYACRDLGEDLFAALAAQDESHLVVVAVRDKKQLRELKRTIIDAPTHLYAAGAPHEDRALAYALQAVDELVPFFLPPDGAEIRKAVEALSARRRLADAGRSLFSATRRLHQQFEWRTRDVPITEACRYLAHLLRETGFCPTGADEARTVLSLEETLTNAVEHGNLELDSSLRSESLLETDPYEELKAQRMADDAFGARKVRVDIDVNGDEARIDIADEGPGFDTSKYAAKIATYANPDRETILENSGKGFALIKKSFDEVAFNEAGNAVTLLRRRARANGNGRPSADAPAAAARG